MAKIEFFPVGNGDMTLITTASGRQILIDLNIRAAADDPGDRVPDVGSALRKRLRKLASGHPCVDVLLISHPDDDHCAGLEKHFYLGPPDRLATHAKPGQIFIRELWSSPMMLRHNSARWPLSADADAFGREARRRVRRFRDRGATVGHGNRILLLGEDDDGDTDDLGPIVKPIDQSFSTIAGQNDRSFSVLVLGPLPGASNETDPALAKNNSSTVLQLSLFAPGRPRATPCRFLTGGDAGVEIWERLWRKHWGRSGSLSYDILQAPHHCSWHSLSHESWSESGGRADPSRAAVKALSRVRGGAIIIASSDPIKSRDSDPPCIGAKGIYDAIANGAGGRFRCVGEEPTERHPGVMTVGIDASGIRVRSAPLPRNR